MKSKTIKDDGVTEIFPNKKVASKVVYLDRRGMENDDGNDNTALGVIVSTGRQKIYKLKADRNKLFNPLLTKEDPSYKIDALDKRTKDQRFKLTTVNQDCFDNYVKFLQTEQDSYITAAQRSL